jgi:RNA polymerase sigma-70 factor (ECF subfamily)
MALPQPDRRALRAARRGDEQAFAGLVTTYQGPLTAYIAKMVDDRGLAEDLTQEVFLRVHQRLHTFKGQCLFSTWLFQIAKNRVLDELRARARRPSAPLEISELSVAPEHPPERAGEIDETVSAIWRAVSELDVELKMPLMLRDVSGLSYREIAETLEIELSTVKWRLYTARVTVQASLAADDIAPEFARAAHNDPLADPVQGALASLPTPT